MLTRRADGTNLIKVKPLCSQGTKTASKMTGPVFMLPETQTIQTPSSQCPFTSNETPDNQPDASPASHSKRRRALALRGAKGDRRAQRGSSRSRSRAALAGVKLWKASGGRPGGVQRGPRRGTAPNRPLPPPAAQVAKMKDMGNGKESGCIK